MFNKDVLLLSLLTLLAAGKLSNAYTIFKLMILKFDEKGPGGLSSDSHSFQEKNIELLFNSTVDDLH